MRTAFAAPTIVCPDWCRSEEECHHVDLENDRAVVDHDGPNFGAFISAGGMTLAETGELVEFDITVHELEHEQMAPVQLRALAADALAAAAWLEAHS